MQAGSNHIDGSLMPELEVKRDKDAEAKQGYPEI